MHANKEGIDTLELLIQEAKSLFLSVPKGEDNLKNLKEWTKTDTVGRMQAKQSANIYNFITFTNQCKHVNIIRFLIDIFNAPKIWWILCLISIPFNIFIIQVKAISRTSSSSHGSWYPLQSTLRESLSKETIATSRI